MFQRLKRGSHACTQTHTWQLSHKLNLYSFLWNV